MTGKEHAIDIFRAAVEAVQPARLMGQALQAGSDGISICGQAFPRNSFNHIYVIGAGKASAAMAVEAEKILGAYIQDGLVTTKYGHSLATEKVRIMEAAHPMPDENCVEAVRRTLALLNKATKDDIVICLISGGASALWCDTPPGITLSDMRSAFDLLVRSGAAISEINSVRKHISRIKGGQLVRYCNDARVFSLIISDVPGDDMDVIASGPTVPDASSYSDAHAVLVKYDLLPDLPAAVREHIEKGMKGAIAETPKYGDAVFQRTMNRVIGSNRVALQAASAKARSLGYHLHVKEEIVTGETGQEARALVQLAREYRGDRPACFLEGGETTLKVTGSGKGGRNQHFVLSALHELSRKGEDNWKGIVILSGGTDGTDGPTDATGAVNSFDTWRQARQQGLSVEAYLQNHDAYRFFQQTGDLLISGPTQTNVMDIMIAIVT